MMVDHRKDDDFIPVFDEQSHLVFRERLNAAGTNVSTSADHNRFELNLSLSLHCLTTWNENGRSYGMKHKDNGRC